MNKDVSPIKHGDFPMPCLLSGVYINQPFVDKVDGESSRYIEQTRRSKENKKNPSDTELCVL